MRLLAHLVRTDIRQFRWAILLWTLLVVAETAAIAIRPSFMADMRVYGNVGMIGGLLWAALQFGMLLIVPLIVQAHPAVGTDAFWMTRPFPPRTVFGAKVVLLSALTVLLPCAARLALMLWIGVPAREALLVTLDTAISSTAWLAVLIAGAVVTLNLPRFALLCGAVVVSFVLLVTLMIMRTQMSESSATGTLVMGSPQPVLPPAEDPTEAILFLLAVTAVGCGLAAMQYRTRRRLASVPVAVGGLMLAVFAIPHWPIPLLKVQSALPAWTGSSSVVQLRAAATVIEMNPQMGWVEGGNPWRSGSTRVSVSGLEPGWAPGLELLDASVTLDDGTTLVSRRRGYQSTPQIDGDDAWRVVTRDVLGVEVFSWAPTGSELAAALVVPAKDLPTPLPVHGRYRGRFALRLAHWEPVAALALRAGAAFQDDSYRFAIQQVDAGPGLAMAVRAREWRATSSFDRKPMIAYAFYVRNTTHSRGLEGRESEPFEGMTSFPIGLPFVMGAGGPSRFFYRAAVVSFPASYGLQGEKIDWKPSWYAGAELVIVRKTETGAVVRTLDIPDVSIIEKR